MHADALHYFLFCFLPVTIAHGIIVPQCQAAHTSFTPSRRLEDTQLNPNSFAPDSFKDAVCAQAFVSGDAAARSLLQIKRRPQSSGWFGSFSQDESTYDEEGLHASQDDPFWATKYGRDPIGASSWEDQPMLSGVFFHESRSGGPVGAWQTHYPHASASGSVVGNRHARENPWRYTPAGWVQDYIPRDESDSPDLLSKRLDDADWFDNSVNQFDGYGREKTPFATSGRHYAADGWLERSVNTTITCKEPGCIARATLQLFDRSTEDARLCKLSIVVHPTDYEDDWSREIIEYWKVNDFTVSSKCNPRARGCNATAEQVVYRCVSDLGVEKIIDSLGTLTLEGKISQMVDECPHNGNLLSAMAVGTCMVRKKGLGTTTTTTLFRMADVYSEAVLKCVDPGCMAETTLNFNPALIFNGGTCALSMNVTQTDYDDKLGVPEEIEFISVGRGNITTKPIQPGRNPCNEEYKGSDVAAADRIFNAVENFDVTNLARESYPAGILRIASKISPQVDECGYDGHLFHANVRIHCKQPPVFSATPPYPLPERLPSAAVANQVTLSEHYGSVLSSGAGIDQPYLHDVVTDLQETPSVSLSPVH